MLNVIKWSLVFCSMCNIQFDTTIVQLNVYNQYVINLVNMAHFVVNKLAWIILDRILIWDRGICDDARAYA